MLRGDLHIHTKYSGDSNLTPENILKKAKDLRLNVIAITDHGTVKGGLETEKISKKLYPGIIVLIGEEVRTRQGEVIALDIRKTIQNGLDMVKTCEMIKKENGLVILPHQFDVLRSGLGKESKKILRFVDAAEGFNARSLFSCFNKKNMRFAGQHDIPLVAGSDAHFSEEIGLALTLIKSRKKKKDVIEAIKMGKTRITGEKSGLRPHIKTFFHRFRK